MKTTKKEYYSNVLNLAPKGEPIIEYRYSGFVTKNDKGEYIFHALAGMDGKKWWVAFTRDISDQF